MEKHRILKILQAGVPLTSTMIDELIAEHLKEARYLEHKFAMYCGHKLQIQHRKFSDQTKINNKLNNDFFATIVDQVVGYMFGSSIVYSLDGDHYSEEVYTQANDYIQRFLTRNDLADLDAELGKYMSIYGYAYRLCYIDRDGYEAVMNLKPSEVVSLDEDGEIFYALRYYDTYDSSGNEVVRVEWYDEANVTVFERKLTKGGVKGKGYELISCEPHLFGRVPVIKFANNEEELGDFDKVLPLIDAYDRLVSDVQNELEEFRQAYMVFDGGAVIDKETIINARQSGAFSLPEGSSAYYLTKTMDSTMIEKQRKTLEENIYKFSKSVNMDDEKFSGASQSGESRKWKLLDLENKAITKERKFSSGLREMFKVLCTTFETRGIKVDYLDIYFNFTRNLPNDLSYIVDVANDLQGIVSKKTVLEMLPMVDDVEYELAQIDEEKAEADIYANTFKAPQDIEVEGEDDELE